MTAPPISKPSRLKVSQDRGRLRAQGLRPIQIWVPDVRAASFRSKARLHAAAVAASNRAEEDQAFIDATPAWMNSEAGEVWKQRFADHQRGRVVQ